MPTAVLWDLDGTLVDTEPAWIAGEYALVADHGGTWSDEHARAIVGSDLLVAAAYIAEHGPVPLSPRQITDRLVAEVVAGLAAGVPWRPGARELLAGLSDAGVPQGLVTMSWRPIVAAVEASLPPGTFGAVVTGDEVERGKPHPEPYERAAELLGVDPADCVAVEDSVTGAASAEAAGCRVVVVPNVVAVPPSPHRALLRTLAGLTPEALGAAAPPRRVRTPGR